MSNRERAAEILDSFPDNQLDYVIAMLQTMKQAIENALIADTPNATTIAALQEGDEMLRTGVGQGWAGSTEELFRQILEE